MTSPFASLVGALTNAGTKAAVGGLQGQQKAQDAQRVDMESALKLLRQQQQDEQQRRVQEATLAHLGAQTTKLNQPEPETFGAPFAGRDETGEGMFERGNRGTNRRIPGLLGPAKMPVAQQHVTDPVTGEVTFFDPTNPPQGLKVHPAQAKPPAAGATAKVSGDERKNAAFYANAVQANDLLRKAPPPGLQDKLGSMVPFAGNYWTSSDYKSMAQAAYQLSEAWLRATSGAAISENEIRRNAMNYFAQPGDDDRARAQKTRSREQIVRSLKQMAGRAVDPNAAPSLDANPDTPSIEDMIRASRGGSPGGRP